MVGKAQKSHWARSGLYGGCSNGVPPISMSTFQSSNTDAPLKFLRTPRKGSFKTTVTPFSRSWWSVVRSESLVKGDTSKRRPSPHLHKVPTRSNKVSQRTLQTVLVFTLPLHTIKFLDLASVILRNDSIKQVYKFCMKKVRKSCPWALTEHHALKEY
jgi:hypothetical protein